MTVVIVVPVLGRAHRVRPLLASIEAATPEPHRTLFVCSPDDEAVIGEIDAAGAEHICTDRPHARGDYAIKINLAYRSTWEPLLFLAADDLHFHAGWLERATARLTGDIGVVGTNDLTNRRTRTGAHSTHSLVTRAYADDFGTIDERRKILHEGYWHEFVDDELVQTASARGAYAHAVDAHVEHLHPMGGKAPMDALYEMQGERMKVGRRLYERRQALWT